MRLEVKIEKLIIDTFSSVKQEDPSGGRLADLVVAILKEAVPTYHAYVDD